MRAHRPTNVGGRIRHTTRFLYTVRQQPYHYLSIGDPDRAEFHYRAALRLAPKRAALYARLARIALMRGDVKQAREMMDRAAALFPNHPEYKPKR